MTTRLRRSPRLKGFDYVGPYAYNLTLVTRRRRAVFQRHEVVGITKDALERARARHAFTLHAFCFMPDHFHPLVSGEAESSLVDFVALFKQLSSYAAKRFLGSELWQTSFYDRVLRQEDDLAQVADYIWHNPVRAGLVDEPADYPYSGLGLRQT